MAAVGYLSHRASLPMVSPPSYPVIVGAVPHIALLAAPGDGSTDETIVIVARTKAAATGLRTGTSFAQLARIVEDDLWLTLIIADLPRHADALAAECGLGRPELCPIASEDHRGEGCIWIRLIEIEERRLSTRTGCELGGCDHTADRRGFAYVADCILGAYGGGCNRKLP
jgi:hypothetical protein